jgi:hypothetical protein
MSSREDTPHFIFINPKPSEYEDPLALCAWNRAIAQYFPSDANAPFSVYEGKLNELDADLLRCDCIVSPANSYGIMDGGCALTPTSRTRDLGIDLTLAMTCIFQVVPGYRR